MEKEAMEMKNLNNLYGAVYPKLLKNYDLLKVIGGGGQATVFLCQNRSTKTEFACKSMSIGRAGNAEAKQEEQIMRKLAICPGVVHLEDVISEEDGSYMHVIIELCECSLDSRIKTQGRLSNNEAALLLRNLALIIKYLHANGVVHRDLKPANVLIASGGQAYNVKVADFGISACFSDPAPCFTAVVGTSTYLAPEVVQKHYSKEVDVWGLGLILYECLTGLPTFPHLNMWNIYQKHRRGEDLAASELVWPAGVVSLEAKSLVMAMLQPKPKERISLHQILSHPWVIKHCTPSVVACEKKGHAIVMPMCMLPPSKCIKVNGARQDVKSCAIAC